MYIFVYLYIWLVHLGFLRVHIFELAGSWNASKRFCSVSIEEEVVLW